MAKVTRTPDPVRARLTAMQQAVAKRRAARAAVARAILRASAADTRCEALVASAVTHAERDFLASLMAETAE